MKEQTMKLNKPELITAMQQYSGKYKKDIEEYLDIFLEVIKQEVAKGNKVNLQGFGTFEGALRVETKIRSFDGSKHDVPAHRTPKFTASDDFRRRLNE